MDEYATAQLTRNGTAVAAAGDAEDLYTLYFINVASGGQAEDQRNY